MAEAFGVVAGAVTIIEVTAKIIKECKHLIKTARDAPKELRQVFVEMSSLKNTLESFQFLSNADPGFSEAVAKLSGVDGALTGCRDKVQHLEAELAKLSVSSAPTGQATLPGKRQRLQNSMKWLLNESKIRGLLDAINKYKSTISLALVGEVARDVKEIKANISTIRQDLSDKHRRKICDWLEQRNPTSDHHNAFKLHKIQTSNWINRHPTFKEWLSGSCRSIWVNGIPGAGKTVFISYLIELTKKHCDTPQASKTCIYYYCSYRYTGDEVGSFLKWTVSQLCRQLKSVPQSIVSMFERNQGPSSTELMEALPELLENSDTVYVLVDALDECCDRADILRVLSRLVSDVAFGKIHVLTTSRVFIDIKAVMKPISVPISMSNPYVDDDIRIYIQSELQSNPKLNGWPQYVLDETLEALVKGAKGMFRWASCQLFILQRKRTFTQLRDALLDLPETLDDTYYRILGDIPEDERGYVRSTILWICAHESLPFTHGIPSKCLTSVVFPEAISDTAKPHMYDLSTLYEVCSCLIRTTTVKVPGPDIPESAPLVFETISLAHYTVKEFFFSPRLSTSPFSSLHISDLNVATEYLSTTLKKCAQMDLSREIDFPRFTTYCRFALNLAPDVWENIIVDNEELWRMYLDTFKLCLPSNESVPEIWEDLGWINCNQIISCNPALDAPSAKGAIIVASLMDIGLTAMMNKFLFNNNLTSLLNERLVAKFYLFDIGHIATFCGTLMEIMTIFSRSSKCSPYCTIIGNMVDYVGSHISPTRLMMHMLTVHHHTYVCPINLKGEDCLVKELLSMGANQGGSQNGITPLQRAVYLWDYHGASALLNACADVNEVPQLGPNAKEHLRQSPLPKQDAKHATHSPLHIIRNSEPEFNDDFIHLICRPVGNLESVRKRDPARIERLLIEHGAEDFIVNCKGERISRGGNTPTL